MNGNLGADVVNIVDKSCTYNMWIWMDCHVSIQSLTQGMIIHYNIKGIVKCKNMKFSI